MFYRIPTYFKSLFGDNHYLKFGKQVNSVLSLILFHSKIISWSFFSFVKKLKKTNKLTSLKLKTFLNNFYLISFLLMLLLFFNQNFIKIIIFPKKNKKKLTRFEIIFYLTGCKLELNSGNDTMVSKFLAHFSSLDSAPI